MGEWGVGIGFGDGGGTQEGDKKAVELYRRVVAFSSESGELLMLGWMHKC